jgi:acetolactate synthase-1/2/3 large subunit
MAIRAELPDDAIIFNESTQVSYWSRHYMPVYAPRTMFGSGYQGTLGYGFATALGAQAGNMDRRVISLSGDGGFFYNVQELSTMVQQKLPMIAIVFNDNAFGNVRAYQRFRYGERYIASDLHNPDMMKLADSYGLTGRRASNPQELRTELRAALAVNEPCLLEVQVGPMDTFASSLAGNIPHSYPRGPVRRA